MCIYALYRYRNCELHHPLGNGPRGGRAFRIRPCQLNMMANNELKDSSQSKHRIYDHALPCEGEECRIYYVDQICHVCNSRGALAAGYPRNKNYGLTVAHVLEWSIQHNQMRFDDFREISYTDPKKDVDEEQPVSPKGLFREIHYTASD